MSRFFTCHWKFNEWRCNEEGGPIRSAGHSSFRDRGIQDNKGHKVYIVSISNRYLFLGGRMTVERIVGREEAVRALGTDNLWDAPEWILGEPKDGTPLNTYRRLAPELSRQLQFLRTDGSSIGLCFIDDEKTKLDSQTTRNVRELTPESAALLDRIIDSTDCCEFGEGILTVTQEMLRLA